MNDCPNCGETLPERERSGIEIDVRPVCRGVWLDRGELDKILARESSYYDDDEYDRGRGDDRRDDPRRSELEYRSAREPAAKAQKKKGFFQTMIGNFTEGGEGGMD